MRDPNELTPQEIWASGAGDYFNDIDGAGEAEIIGDGMAGAAAGYTLGAINAAVIAPVVVQLNGNVTVNGILPHFRSKNCSITW